MIDIVPKVKYLKLIYRATREEKYPGYGFKSKDFRKKCKDIGATIILYHTCTVKKNINRIIGGFTDIPWKKNIKKEYKYMLKDKNSFLF